MFLCLLHDFSIAKTISAYLQEFEYNIYFLKGIFPGIKGKQIAQINKSGLILAPILTCTQHTTENKTIKV